MCRHLQDQLIISAQGGVIKHVKTIPQKMGINLELQVTEVTLLLLLK